MSNWLEIIDEYELGINNNIEIINKIQAQSPIYNNKINILTSKSKMKEGIVRYKEYTWWKHTSVVYDSVLEYLEKAFPGDIIIPGFNNIDLANIDKNLPIEIERTILPNSTTPSISEFEDEIRSQIEANIKYYGKCWFFFDADFLKYLQNIAGQTVSINFDWFYKLVKTEKLKVFTVTYDGKIEEKHYNDFEFIKKLSSTCVLGDSQDSRILEQNKFDILKDIFDATGITTEEMKKLRKTFDEKSRDRQKKIGFSHWLSKFSSDREKLISFIYQGLNDLNNVNLCLDCNCGTENKARIVPFNYLGLTDILYGQSSATIKRFIDKYDIAKYFPGYLRNKEMWDYLKESQMKLNNDQFNAIITGRVNPLEWKALIQGGW